MGMAHTAAISGGPVTPVRHVAGRDAGRPIDDHAIIGVLIPFRRRAAGSTTADDRTTHPPAEAVAAVRPEDVALRLAADGDQDAFARFYDLTSSLVFGVVVKVLRNPALAEEVTQEVFVELWRLAPRFDSDRGSARTWAATLARRRAIDRVRSEEAARRREDRDAGTADVPVDLVSELVVERSERDVLVKALEQLSDRQREAISLAYFGGHSYRAVAVMLNEPEGTIKTRIRDGLTRLRHMMEAAS